MKKRLMLGILLGFFLISVNLSLVSAGTCSSPDQTIMKLSAEDNAHGALWDDGAYTWDICFDDIYGAAYSGSFATVHDCAGKTPILWLSDSTNAHASASQSANYATPVCYGDMECSVKDSCTAEEIGVLSLTDVSNSHLSSFGVAAYPKKLCCVASKIQWEDMDGNVITEAFLGQKVRMVKTYSSSGIFEIYDWDGGSYDEGTDNDDPLYTVAGGNAIAGVAMDGNLVGEWRITQDDILLANDGNELDDNHTENYFAIDGDTSDPLIVWNRYSDEPLVVGLINPPCGAIYNQDDSTTIIINASDPDDEIMGNVSIDGAVVKNFTNGVTVFDHTWITPGNQQVEAYAVNDKGFIRRVISSVIVVAPAVTKDYIAACINKPADFSDIGQSNVQFLANSTKALRCITPVDAATCTELNLTDLTFAWRFSDGLVNFNRDGNNPRSYDFHKNFVTAGNNWAILEVEIK